MLSPELMIERAGNFTSSEMHRLLCGWDKPQPPEPTLLCLADEFRKMDSKPLVSYVKKTFQVDVTGADVNELWQWIRWHDIPQGLITYAEEKALETLFDYDESLNFSTVHTRNGEERELECMELLIEETGIDFIHIGEDQIHVHSDQVGATPDGVVLDDLDLIYTGAEAKCKSPLVHARLWLINSSEELKQKQFEHYVQIQTQMLVTGSDHWYFAIFNPHAKSKEMKFKYIIIQRDDAFIKILKQRIEIAKGIKAEFLEKFKAEKLKVAA